MTTEGRAMEPTPTPEDVQIIERTLAVRWSDGREDYYDAELLRAISPSAENLGEADFFGNIKGGDPRTSYPGVLITGWEYVGGYALRLFFSDGHSTGYFTYRYLRLVADKERTGFEFPFRKQIRFCSHDHSHDEE
jgi:DUF971 family protein